MASRPARRPLRSSVAALVAGTVAALPLAAGPARADPPRPPADVSVERICTLIERHAARENLPPHFLARLIWKESRFDAAAVSPAGAQGIAQFMPGTAKARGLADPFSIEQAIPASARYLAELRAGYGNLGLAAAAYNAGETRVGRWLAGGFLPLETEDYVLDIFGEPSENFTDRANQSAGPPIEKDKPFAESCRALPVIATRTVPMSSVVVKPWGVQVAGNFRRAAAIRQWERLRKRLSAAVAEAEPVVSRVRSGRGRRAIYAVRIGAESRGEANAVCARLRQAGGSCVVMRNR